MTHVLGPAIVRRQLNDPAPSQPHLVIIRLRVFIVPFEAQEAGWAFPFFDFVAAINYYHRHHAGLHGG